jgi:hypothetical protein
MCAGKIVARTGGRQTKSGKWLIRGKVERLGEILVGSGSVFATADAPAKLERGDFQMIRKILFTASLGSLLLVGAPVITHGQQGAGPEGQSQQATKSVTGKVTTIGNQGHSFAVEIDAGGSKQTMQFVVDKNTQVVGQVKAGTMVAVDYQPADGGQNLCVKVTAQG